MAVKFGEIDSIDFHLEIGRSGWATLEICFEKIDFNVSGKASISVSYTTNAFRDLAAGILTVCEDHQLAQVMFDDEQTLSILSLRFEKNLVHCDLYLIIDSVTFSVKNTLHEDMKILDFSVKPDFLVWAAQRLLKKLKDDLGEDGYKKIWKHPFPDEELQKLTTSHWRKR